MVFDEWQNGILVAFIVIGKSQKNDLDPILQALSKHMPTIGCLLLSLLTMFKLKSMC
jgi:hypothetical protein